MKRRFTGAWQPSKPTFNCGYVACEHARKVRLAEARARQALLDLAAALDVDPPSPAALAWDARQGVRWLRTGSRAYLSFRQQAARRLGCRIPVGLSRQLSRALSASRHDLEAPPWRSDLLNWRTQRLRPGVSGLYQLIWPANKPPWPGA